MKTDYFDFTLPDSLIAKYPLDKRDQSRLLHYNPESKTIKHLNFTDIIDILQPGDLLVCNNTKVLAARLFLERIKTKSDTDSTQEEDQNNKKIELLLTKPQVNKDNESNGYVWEFLAKPMKRVKIGHEYLLENGQKVTIETDDAEPNKQSKKFVNFGSFENFKKATAEAGQVPIPPYMSRESEELDHNRYQTIYAKENSKGASIAAPTAGLHFTDDIFAKLKERGVELHELTLHVGTGTFLPIKVDDIHDHKMQAETFHVAKETWNQIVAAKKAGRRIVTVGSTSTRCLEALANTQGINEAEQDLESETDIYIYPGYEFKMADCMLTNFHLPKSSLILLVSAFAGRDEIMDIYNEAIKEEYRFYSYGDCMLMY